MILLISGKQRSGKGLVGSLIQEALPLFSCVGFADALKEEYCSLEGLPLSEIDQLKNNFPEHRRGLIILSEKRKAEDDGYWAKKLLGRDNIIVTDFRFMVELETFPKAFLIRVERDRALRENYGVLSNEEHNSETVFDAYPYFDWTVYNDCSTVDELRLKLSPLFGLLNNLL